MVGDKKNFVSVIIPVLNGHKLIGECIDSIISQDYPKDNFEVIVVDNGSTDGTIDIVKNFQKDNKNINLYHQKIKSSYAARNLGIVQSKGDILVFTDADCIADKYWLSNIVRYFSDKSVGGVAGEILPYSKDNIVEKYAVTEEILSQKRTFNSKFLPYAQTANAAYRRELISQIGYFDEVISGGDADYSWRMQLHTNYKIVYAQNAKVLHKHRTDLKGLFKQRFKHGYGFVLIRNKYKGYADMNDKKNNNDNNKNNNISFYQKIVKIKKDGILLPTIINSLGFNLGRLYAKLLLLNNAR